MCRRHANFTYSCHCHSYTQTYQNSYTNHSEPIQLSQHFEDSILVSVDIDVRLYSTCIYLLIIFSGGCKLKLPTIYKQTPLTSSMQASIQLKPRFKCRFSFHHIKHDFPCYANTIYSVNIPFPVLYLPCKRNSKKKKKARKKRKLKTSKFTNLNPLV